MINGAHVIIYSTDAEKDRAVLRDVLKLPNVDVGDGWLIFGLPPSEVAVHPSTRNDVHEFYLMCADIKAFADEMKKRGIDCGPLEDQGWGILSHMKLPGGGKLGVYQPRHARPPAMVKSREQARTGIPSKKPKASIAKKPRSSVVKRPKNARR